jgi:hypothetical protein
MEAIVEQIVQNFGTISEQQICELEFQVATKNPGSLERHLLYALRVSKCVHNPYDSKAIRVDIQGNTVGYLSRENARQYRKRLEKAGHKGMTATCFAMVVGGWDRGSGDKGHFGVRLDLPKNAASSHKRQDYYVYAHKDPDGNVFMSGKEPVNVLGHKTMTRSGTDTSVKNWAAGMKWRSSKMNSRKRKRWNRKTSSC